MFLAVSFTVLAVNVTILSRLTFVDWERRYTQRYEEYIYQRVQNTSMEQVSREEGLSWDQVQGIFRHKFAQKKTQPGVK